jgi:sulfoxide reductase heme-binding subunit YedZ
VTAYWYLTRGSGAVALILLTVSVVLGVAAMGRVRGPAVPSFVVHGLHRSVSLLAVVFLALHVVTAVLDSFAPIALLDAVVPFLGTYRPLWLGLGAVAFDLLLAVAVTSVLRARLGYRKWRGVHWLAYAAWPVAVLHTFGTGSDVRMTWMLVIAVACTIAVLGAVAFRVALGWPGNIRLRAGAIGVAAAFLVGLVAWLPVGPLGRHWARRAGTPARLLGPAAVRGGHA